MFLGIDTATPDGSIALAAGGRTINETLLEERAWHARDLLQRIETLIDTVGRPRSDLRGIGVAVGPGSFTGVRIGMATGKGMAYALDIGLAGTSTLEALARANLEGVGDDHTSMVPVIEAGRGEFYAALFRRQGSALIRMQADRSWPPGELAACIPAGSAIFGNGVETLLGTAAGLKDKVTVIAPSAPLAGAIAVWVAGAVNPETGYRAGTLAPNYVRPSDAEVKRRRP